MRGGGRGARGALSRLTHIAGSPFRVYVLPQLPDATTTTASGSGTRYAYTDTPASFAGSYVVRGADA